MGAQVFYVLFSIRSGEEGTSGGRKLEQRSDPHQRVVLSVRVRGRRRCSTDNGLVPRSVPCGNEEGCIRTAGARDRMQPGRAGRADTIS